MNEIPEHNRGRGRRRNPRLPQLAPSQAVATTVSNRRNTGVIPEDASIYVIHIPNIVLTPPSPTISEHIVLPPTSVRSDMAAIRS